MSEWISWAGGECPLPPRYTPVEVTLMDGSRRGALDAEILPWGRLTPNRVREYRVMSRRAGSITAGDNDIAGPAPSPNAHYRQGEIECIDAIRAALTDEEWRGYCKGNILKYTWRERHKGGNDTLVKAQDYLRWAIAGKAEGKR